MIEQYKEANIKKIGIMGGTFDPVHYGHLVAAEVVRAELDLEKVIFIPTGRPPHKRAENVSESEHRYLMTVLATAANPNFEVSRLEIDKDTVTYTVDTVKDLIGIYGKDTLIYFITGADAVLELLSWHKVEELLSLCSFVAVTRPGFNKQELEQKVAEIKSNYNGEIICIEVPLLAISSTDIRDKVKNGMTIKYLLPEEVEKYIAKTGLYKE
ncbi:MAG: nicotinate-nucleotide adenylyltransferase [Caulobacteraceae bacterium]